MAESKQVVLTPEKAATQYSNTIVKWISEDMADGKLSSVLPPGYNWKTEVNTALLYIFQNVKNINTCTPDSIMSALRDMVLQGLSITKKQVYPIPRDGKLLMQRSYYGTITALHRMFPSYRISANVIYEGDEFEYLYDEIGGFFYIGNVRASIDNIGKQIKLAFGQIYDTEKNQRIASCVMTWPELQEVWKKSSDKSHTVHSQFPQEMAKRSLINRMCKTYVNMDNAKIPPEIIAAYNRSLDAEFDDDQQVRDVTPPETPSERAKLVSGKSKGAAGLSAILASDAAEKEPQKAGENTVKLDENGMIEGTLDLGDDSPEEKPKYDFDGIPF